MTSSNPLLYQKLSPPLSFTLFFVSVVTWIPTFEAVVAWMAGILALSRRLKQFLYLHHHRQPETPVILFSPTLSTAVSLSCRDPLLAFARPSDQLKTPHLGRTWQQSLVQASMALWNYACPLWWRSLLRCTFRSAASWRLSEHEPSRLVQGLCPPSRASGTFQMWLLPLELVGALVYQMDF